MAYVSLKPKEFTKLQGNTFGSSINLIRDLDGLYLSGDGNMLGQTFIFKVNFDPIPNGDVLSDGTVSIYIYKRQDSATMSLILRLLENGAVIYEESITSSSLNPEIIFNFDRSLISGDTFDNFELEIEATETFVDKSGQMVKSVWSFDQITLEANVQPAINAVIPPSVPQIISPINGEVTSNNKPTFKAIVNDEETATLGDKIKLVVELSDDNFTNNITTLESTSVVDGATASVMQSTALSNGIYKWRAKAVDLGGLESGYTPIYTFEVDNKIPDKPTNLSPENNAIFTSGSVTISGTATDAESDFLSVQVQVARDKNFLDIISDQNSIASNGNFSQLFFQMEQGNYYWRARSIENSTGRTSDWTYARGIFVDIQTSGVLRPDSIVSQNGFTSTVPLSAVSDDPDSPNSSWATTTSQVNSSIQVGFQNPTVPLLTGAGMQEFKVLLKTGNARAGATATIRLYEGSTLLSSSSTIMVTSTTGSVHSFTWDANLLANKSGTNVQCRIDTFSTTSGRDKDEVDIGAIEWNYIGESEVQDPMEDEPIVEEPTDPEDPPTGGTLVENVRTLKPTAITFIDNLTPNNVSYLTDSLTTPDSNGLTPINNTTQPKVRVSFDPPIYELTGIQTIRANFVDSNWVGLRIEVYENGVNKFTSGNSYNGYEGVIAEWDFDASILDNPTTENVEIQFVGVLYNGMTLQEIRAVEWFATTLESLEEEEPNPNPTESQNYVTPTNLFPFNNSAWKETVVKATPSSLDDSQVKLIVEYSKDQTFTSGVHRSSSSLVNSGTEVSVPLDRLTYVDGDIIYWRAWTSNNDELLASPRTLTYNFTYKPNGFFSSATEFMQQGNPDVHYKIIDISEYQGTVDWQQVYDSGVHHVYLRAYGSSRTTNNGNGDTMFETYVQQAKAVGIKTGAYHYAMGSVPLDLAQARAEADLFIAKLEAGYGSGQYGDLMPILDLEDNIAHAVTGQSWQDLGAEGTVLWANEFRNHFESRTGRVLGLYTGDNFVRDTMNNFNHDDLTGMAFEGTSGNLLKDMPLWIQGYTKYDRYQGYVMPICGGWTRWDILQYSENGTQEGIAGNVDQNFTEPIEWVLEPNDVAGVSISGNSDVTIMWNANTEEDVTHYGIFLDGLPYDMVDKNANSYVFPSSEFTGGQYNLGVKAVDFYGDYSKNMSFVTYTYEAPVLTPAPKVTIISVSQDKISNVDGMDKAYITFSFDVDTNKFTVNVNGVSHDTGIVAHEGGGKTVIEMADTTVLDLSVNTVQQISIIVAGMEIVAEVDWKELYGEGQNRVNIYGRNKDGIWTPYTE
jgi:GH25 family lysozyme M1 (1,4-beta-N-acetylmuramidase)